MRLIKIERSDGGSAAVVETAFAAAFESVSDYRSEIKTVADLQTSTSGNGSIALHFISLYQDHPRSCRCGSRSARKQIFLRNSK